MHKHVLKFSFLGCGVLAAATVGLLLLSACRKAPVADAGLQSPRADSEEFHADNDIAMTVRSLADALKVGEPLDSVEYDFKGVLTDGQGSPLYTDVQGSPGMWEVDVLDKRNVIIRNLYLGDLLPLDLQTYILQSLALDTEQQLSYNVHDAVDEDDTEISVYDFGGGYLRFEVRAAMAPNGLEGPLLNIIMSADPPAGVETQTSA
jgi:hypothetical protein